MLLGFGKATMDLEIVEKLADNIADMAVREIAKAVPEECLCIAAIDEILERTTGKVKTMTIASFRQCPEENMNRKPTINDLRKENGLSEIPDGDIVLTKV